MTVTVKEVSDFMGKGPEKIVTSTKKVANRLDKKSIAVSALYGAIGAYCLTKSVRTIINKIGDPT